MRLARNTILATIAFMTVWTGSMVAAQDWGRNYQLGAVTVTLSKYSTNPFIKLPGLESTIPGQRGDDGVMVLVKSDDTSITGFTVAVKVKLATGAEVTREQIVAKLPNYEFTPAVFVLGEVAEVLSVKVEELKPVSVVTFE